MRLRRVLFIALALAACEKTQECKELESMVKHNQGLLEAAQNKAAVHARLLETATKAENETTTFLEETGLNWSEDKLNAALDKRMKQVPGSRVVRSSRFKEESSTQNLLRRAKTFWTVEFAEKELAKGLQTAVMFTGEKPIFMFEKLSFDPKGNGWLLELGRAVIDEVPNKPLPTPLPKLKVPAQINSEFGFCGASTLRSQLLEIKDEYARAKDKAEDISVLLPKQATWKGMQRRAKILVAVEMETRKIVQRLMKGVADLKLKVHGLAFEEPFIIAEIKGGERQAKRLKKHMGVLAINAEFMNTQKGRIRILVPNGLVRSFQNKGGPAPKSSSPAKSKGHHGHKH